MDSRTRVSLVLNGKVPDRVPTDDSYWETTMERWRREGLPAGVTPATYFENDIVRIGGATGTRPLSTSRASPPMP